MSCQMLLAQPTAFCAHAADWPGVSCGWIRFTTSYLTLSPSSVVTSRTLGSTFTTLFEPRYSRFGYFVQAARKRPVFEMMFGLASRTMSLDFGLLVWRYHAT